jgi:hypothetical protein
MALYTPEIKQALDRWNGIQVSPSNEARKFPRGLRVFENPFLENWIARAHPVIPGVWVLPLVTYLFWRGADFHSASAQLGIALAGVLGWTLLEYVIHRFWFHFPSSAKWSAKTKHNFFMMHGYHHEYPSDPGRLVMPIMIAQDPKITGTGIS